MTLMQGSKIAHNFIPAMNDACFRINELIELCGYITEVILMQILTQHTHCRLGTHMQHIPLLHEGLRHPRMSARSS